MFQQRRIQMVGTAAVAVAVLLGLSFHSLASAQAGAGTLTGRVVWGTVIRCPLPAGADAAEGAVPAASPAESASRAPGTDSTTPGVVRPVRPMPLPAGAVLVAVQGSTASARTDESGRFSIENVPAGQYLTVAAGPVTSAGNAFALRPNVMASAGRVLDVGTLYLSSTGYHCGYGIAVPQGDAAPSEPGREPTAIP